MIQDLWQQQLGPWKQSRDEVESRMDGEELRPHEVETSEGRVLPQNRLWNRPEETLVIKAEKPVPVKEATIDQ